MVAFRQQRFCEHPFGASRSRKSKQAVPTSLLNGTGCQTGLPVPLQEQERYRQRDDGKQRPGQNKIVRHLLSRRIGGHLEPYVQTDGKRIASVLDNMISGRK